MMASMWMSAVVLLLISLMFWTVSATGVVASPLPDNTATLRDACRLKPDPGFCRAYFERIAYNVSSGQCEMFVYGGCQGNGNRFSSMESCMEYCKAGLCSDISSCTLECPLGFKVDADGCRICECKVVLQTTSSPPKLVAYQCPLRKCRAIYCPNGFSLDSNGCRTCECAVVPAEPTASTTASRHVASRCSPIMCHMFCENGFKRDENGCDICSCNDDTARPSCAPLSASCDMSCPNGMKKNAEGCQICECADSAAETSRCPTLGISCNMHCADGFKKDANGCDLCKCNDGTPRAACPALAATCTMFCENGFKSDANGCAICACNDIPPTCPPEGISCNMFCADGFQKDANGCTICKCNNSSAPRCPLDVTCRMYCKNGFKKDANGCSLCECDDSGHNCPIPTCRMHCENGFKKNAVGCEICECNPCPELSAMCTISCPTGMATDENGCTVCRCKDDADAKLDECPKSSMCLMYCEHGFETDSRGCPVCRCKKPPVCPASGSCKMFCRYMKNPVDGTAACRTCKCASPMLTDMLCYATKLHSCTQDGCLHSRGVDSDPDDIGLGTVCQEDPCLNEKCPEGQKCIVNYGSAGVQPMCVDGRAWCPDSSCRMYCEFGFAMNEYGCETCKCRQQPKDSSCKNIYNVNTICPFGHKSDEDGCETDECLKNPCATLSFNCATGKVCEAYRMKNCLKCPATPRCIDHAHVQYVKISVGYVYGSEGSVDNKHLTENFKASMAKVVKVDDNMIRGVTFEWLELRSKVVLSFNVLLPSDNLEVNPESYVNNLIAEVNDMSSTSRVLEVDGNKYFTLESHTIEALYYSDDYVEHPADDYHEHRSYLLYVVIASMVFVAVVIGLIMLMSRNKQRRGKGTPIYKRTSESDSASLMT